MDSWVISRIFFVACIFVAKVTPYSVSSAGSLYTGLTTGYNVNNRPTASVNVSVGLAVNSINYLNADTQTLSVNGEFTVVWADTRFVWTPASFSSIDKIYLTTTQCWHPNLLLDNAVTYTPFFSDDDMIFSIAYTGEVTATVSGVFSVSCDVQNQYFPFVTQSCVFRVRSGSYDTTVLSMTSSTLSQDNYVENGEWALTSTSLTSSDTTLSSLSYTDVLFYVTLSRRTAGSVMVLLMPLMLLSFLGLATFLIPVQSEAKVGFCVTLLLAEVVLLTSVYESIPSTSKQTSVLAVYLLLVLILSLLETVVAVVILKLYHNKLKDRPVSAREQKAAKAMSKLTCWQHDVTESSIPSSETPTSPETPTTSETKITLKRKPSLVRPDSNFQTNNGAVPGTRLDKAWHHSEAELKRNARKYDWEEIAEMVNRLCLIIFFVLRAIVTLVLLTVMSAAGNS